MGPVGAGIAFAASLALALALVHVPLGDYMHRVFTSTRHLRAELLLYRGLGVDADAEQSWASYVRSVLAFSAVSILGLYGLLRLQDHLPGSLGRDGASASGGAGNDTVSPALAWNT